MNGRDLHSVDSDDDENAAVIRGEGYIVVDPLEPSNDVFKILLDALRSQGVVYTSPKGKGREVPSERRVTATSTSSDVLMGGNEGSERNQATTAPGLPLFFEDPMTEEGGSEIDPALLVSVHCPGLGYGHVVFQAKKLQETWGYKPLTAIYFHHLLRISSDLQLDEVNGLIDRMVSHQIKLATSRSPVFMEQKLLHNNPFTGYRRLGYLEQLKVQLNARDTPLEPVLDSEEKRRLLKINGLDEAMDMYVLYVWTDVSVITEEQQDVSDIIYRILPSHRQWR